MQACPSCGASHDEVGRYCPTCGAVMKTTAETEEPIALTEVKSERRAASRSERAAATSSPHAAHSAPAASHRAIDDAAPGARTAATSARVALGTDASSVRELATAATETVSARDVAIDASAREDAPRGMKVSASLVGMAIGDFDIEGVIGGGSFGTVYRGRQRGLDRPVAIKVPTYEIAADPIQARRFAREARAAARIVHPGVVAIYAVGELVDGRPYLAMQLIEGVPLDRILDGGPVPAVRALRIARAIASALSETHAADVVHRDLKPSNIMWRRDRNGDDRITLVDFGIAVCRPGNADASRLTSNGLIGTPHYMAPEQAQGETVDARADLYGLGCVLFELVTATTPYDGSGFEVLVAHLNKPAPRPSERVADVPAPVDALIAALLCKRPEDRPASADDVVARIDAALAQLTRPAPSTDASADTEPPPPAPRSRRRWLAMLAAAAAIVGAAGFAAYTLTDAVTDDDDAELVEPAPGTLTLPSGEHMRRIARDDGELIVRTLVPEVIRARVPMRAFVELRTKLGGVLPAKQVVVTIEDAAHNATAITAKMRKDRPGHYAFRHTFAQPGTYVIRVFPSETETVSTIELDVAR